MSFKSLTNSAPSAASGVAMSGLILFAGVASAQEVGPVPYSSIKIPPAIAVDLPEVLDSSGITIEGAYSFPGGQIGRTFQGQSVQSHEFYGELFDDVVGSPSEPLTLKNDSSQSLWIGDPIGSASLAVSGIGQRPGGTNDPVGAGSISILLDEPVCQFAFKANIKRPMRPISGDYLRGPLNVIFYTAEGKVLAEYVLGGDGNTNFGFSQSTGAIPSISGIAIENIDEGGIAVSDMKFSVECMPFVS